MQRLIVSDIFGRTPALERLALELQGDVEIIDPYDSSVMEFENENDAYVYFTHNVGLDAYAEKLSNALKAMHSPVSLLGFSVGASASWKLSENPKTTNVVGAVLFYGSQIRHYSKIEPRFPTSLVFPKAEPHFLVTELISVLRQKENVHIHHAQEGHGFMNDHSQNYSVHAYKKYMQALCDVPCSASFHTAVFDKKHR